MESRTRPRMTRAILNGTTPSEVKELAASLREVIDMPTVRQYVIGETFKNLKRAAELMKEAE